MRRSLLLSILSVLLLLSIEGEERAFPLISETPGQSFIVVEVGTAPGISLTSRVMTMSLQYYYPKFESIALTTDIKLIDFDWSSFNLGAGMGTGITFKAEVGDFDSYILLRFPLSIQYGDIGLSLTPMVTASMFKQVTEFDYYGTINVTYRRGL